MRSPLFGSRQRMSVILIPSAEILSAEYLRRCSTACLAVVGTKLLNISSELATYKTQTVV